MLSLKEIIFRHHRFKVAMFFFCFEASLAILSNQVNDLYISSIMNNSRVLPSHNFRGKKLQFTQSNRMQYS